MTVSIGSVHTNSNCPPFQLRTCIFKISAYYLLHCTTAITNTEIAMNFDTAVVSNKPRNAAVHNAHAHHPIAHHAYRLSQVVTYGVASPQTFVH